MSTDQQIEYANLHSHHSVFSSDADVTRILSEVQPNEVCNCGAQFNVAVSFEVSEFTGDVDTIEVFYEVLSTDG